MPLSRPLFPRSLLEFDRLFPHERSCFDFVIQSRWPERRDFRCASCGGSGTSERGSRLVLACASCKRLQSATAGTVMHGSHLPLRTWLLAAWLLVTDKRGVSAKQLERALGLSYETAYMILQRLRASMVDPDRESLRGVIEVDETFLGGVKHGKKGLESVGKEGGKFIVLGAVEVRVVRRKSDGFEYRRPGRLRLRHAENLSSPVLIGFVRDIADPGSMIVTDGRESYAAVTRWGYGHRVESTALGMSQKVVLQYLHLAFSNLKAWIDGTFHGAVGAKHLQGYLNEFCFRFNRRDNLFAAFQTLLGIAPRVEAPSYERIYAEGEGRFTHISEGQPSRTPSANGPAQVVGRE